MTRRSLRERCPGPWRIDETPGGFRVVDANGVLLAYIYARDDLARLSKRDYLTTAEALAMAKAIAALGTPNGSADR